jgi:phage shock protein A
MIMAEEFDLTATAELSGDTNESVNELAVKVRNESPHMDGKMSQTEVIRILLQDRLDTLQSQESVEQAQSRLSDRIGHNGNSGGSTSNTEELSEVERRRRELADKIGR